MTDEPRCAHCSHGVDHHNNVIGCALCWCGMMLRQLVNLKSDLT